MSGHKLDIFETLAAIDRRNFDYFEKLSDEQRKGFAPPVVLKWVAGVEGPMAEQYLWLTNQQVNVNFWDIYEHPELQFKLMASVGRGRNQRHKWIALPKTKSKTDKISVFLSQYWPDANDEELGIILNQYTHETFSAFVLSAGLVPAEEKEVIAAYERLSGKPPKKPKKASKKGEG